MQASYDLTPGGVLTIIGLLSCLGTLYYWLSLLWLYIRPSGLHRYLHTTADGQSPWALVTGSTGGIGQQLSHELAARGFNVVLHGRSPDKLQRLQAAMARRHPTREFRTFIADAAKADTATPGDWTAQIGDIHLTVMINNAGGSADRRVGKLEVLGPDRLLADASLNAVFPTILLSQLIPQLERSAPALIINVGSVADLGLALVGSYSASKAYLTKLTETMSREMRVTGRDIEVLAVRVANVWGTGQTVVTTSSPSLLVPDATTMAKAILGRVGCGRHVVVGYWAHALQLEALQSLPGFLFEWLMRNFAKDWDGTGMPVKQD